MTKSTGKSSSAIDAAETKVTTAKRAVSMAAEKAPAKTAVKVAKPAAKTAVKKAAKTAAADKPEKATKTRAKKAEDKLADLVGSARPAPAAAVLVVRPRTPTMIPTASTIRWTAKAKSCPT